MASTGAVSWVAPSCSQTFHYGGSATGTQTVVNAQSIATSTIGSAQATTTTTPLLNAQGVPIQAAQIGTLYARSQWSPLTDFLMNGATHGGFGDALGGQFAILSVPSMSATLRLLNEDTDTEFLAHPRIVTANNLKATIKITRNQPVPQLNFNEQTAQAVFSGFQDKEFGNTLVVTPQINKDNFITMSVQPEISNKVADATFTFSGLYQPARSSTHRKLDSNVLIKSGDTLAIGGLLKDRVALEGRTKGPVLGDIPIVGYAFQERLNSRVKRNLLIFVTPTIIEQGYGTGLEDQVTGLHHSGEECLGRTAAPPMQRTNARGASARFPTSERSLPTSRPPASPRPPRRPFQPSEADSHAPTTGNRFHGGQATQEENLPASSPKTNLDADRKRSAFRPHREQVHFGACLAIISCPGRSQSSLPLVFLSSARSRPRTNFPPKPAPCSHPADKAKPHPDDKLPPATPVVGQPFDDREISPVFQGRKPQTLRCETGQPAAFRPQGLRSAPRRSHPRKAQRPGHRRPRRSRRADPR